MNKSSNEYECVRAWCRMMGSHSYYADQQVAEARTDNAPPDAIYKRSNSDKALSKEKDQWARLRDVRSPATQWYFQQNHPELVKEFAPVWLED